MLNRVILIGRLANEPELKWTPSGIAVTTFRLAVDRPMSSEARQSGQAKEADFIDIVAWRQQAEFASNYLGKGRLVAVEGRLHIRQYTASDGTNRRSAEVVVDQLKSLERPRDTVGSFDSGDSGARDSEQSAGGRYENPAPATARPADVYQRPAQSPPVRPNPGPPAMPAARPVTEEFDADPFADELDDPFAEP